MKKLFLLIGLLLAGTANAQPTFQKTYGGTASEGANSLQLTKDGGYVLVGSTTSFGAGSADVYVVRLDSLGDTLWTRAFGGTDEDYGHYIQECADSGFIITGITKSFGAGDFDVYLIKTDYNGNLLWSKTFGGPFLDYGECVIQCADSGFLVAGMTENFGTGIWNVYLIKTNVSGNIQWTKTYGGSSLEWAYSVRQTYDGGYIVSGFTVSFAVGNADYYLLKLDPAGNLSWSKTYGGGIQEMCFSVEQTSDSGYVLIGETNSFGAGWVDIYLVRTNSIGDTLWTRTYGGPSFDNANSVKQTADNGFILAGRTRRSGQDDCYLIKTNSLGDTLWTKAYGGFGDDRGTGVELTNDGGYLLYGSAGSFGAGNFDVYIVKTDSLGNSDCNKHNWTTFVEGTSTVVSSGAIAGNGTNVSTPFTITSNTTTADSTLCICDSLVPLAVFSYTDSLLTVAFSDSSVSATSWFWDFGDGNTDTVQNPTHTYANSDTYYVCLYITGPCGTDSICDSITVTDVGINQLSISSNQITIHPNPTNGKFRVESHAYRQAGLKFGVETIEIYDLFGRLLLRSNKAQIDMSSYPAGLYIWRVGQARGKLVKE